MSGLSVSFGLPRVASEALSSEAFAWADSAIEEAFAEADDTAAESIEQEYEYVVRSPLPRTVTVGTDCVTHQSGMRTVAVVVVCAAAPAARARPTMEALYNISTTFTM